MKWVSTLSLFALVGCGGPTIGAIPLPVMNVQLSDSNGLTFAQVQLLAGDGSCPQVASGAEADIDGLRLKQTSAGGSGDGFFRPRCLVPTFYAGAERNDPLPEFAVGEMTITVRQGDASMALTAVRPCTQRAMTLVAPADGVLNPGDEVDVLWGDPDDVLTVNHADVARSDHTNLVIVEDVVVSGRHLRFKMPSDGWWGEGQGSLAFSGPSLAHPGGYAPAITRCDGAATCDLSCFRAEPPSVSVKFAR